ncbi:cytochrome P450 [Rhizophagus irregularis DAOM 181602=DAOM 197198]|nr:cytochrome P450 [Rhizophagus irregularis DAOM 181602=DAOM 197198]
MVPGNSHSFLDIVADEAIFHRLIKCKEKWPHIRPLLGQWHTSKDFCSVLIVLFFSYGLLSLASCLGVRFLDKFESAVDFKSTARVLNLIWVAVGIAINIYITEKGILFSEIMNSDNICLKIWNLYYQWAGIWKAYWMGIQVGNFDLQRDSLSAAGSLYASAAKSNYTTAIAHFLATIAAHPQLEEKLRYCGAFKIPYDADSDSENVRHVCFGFDEALETFGVRFIKGNISGNVIDEKNVKIQIKALQSERERIDLLMSEYLDDNSISYIIFGMDDPLSHQLFQNYPPTEIHQEGLDRLILCYSNGLERIKGIYQQKVLKIESRVTKGRRSIPDPSQSSQKNTDENLNEQSTDHLSDAAKPQPKQKKHRTTDEEMKILSVLKVYKDKLPDDAIASVCNQLSEVWTKKKRLSNSIARKKLRIIVPTARRTNLKDGVIGKYYIPKNTEIFIGISVLQRLTEIWGPTADNFDPKRWLDPSLSKNIINLNYLVPFLNGARGCIGNKVALAEAKILLGMLIRNFIFKPIEGFQIKKRAFPIPKPDPYLGLAVSIS